MSSIATGAEILVDSAVLRSTAENTRKKISDMKKAQEALDSRVRGMDAYWKGEGSVHVRSEYEKCKKEVHSIINRLNEYPADLLQAAGIYEAAEAQSEAESRPLPQDVIL